MVASNASPRAIKAKTGRGRMVGGLADQDEELADLQRRFTALDDEAKAGVPSTQITPRSTLRAQRERSTAAAVRENNDAELARLDDQITTLRRKHDELAHANMEKRRELEKLTDRLHDLSKEAIAPSAEDNSVMKEIQALEARLQKAVAKYEDAYEVRRTYEQIVKRLKEERIGFANQLEARELTLSAKEGDYEELLLMSHDANQSKELAKAELSKFEAQVSEERKLREKGAPPARPENARRAAHAARTARRCTALHAIARRHRAVAPPRPLPRASSLVSSPPRHWLLEPSRVVPRPVVRGPPLTCAWVRCRGWVVVRRPGGAALARAEEAGDERRPRAPREGAPRGHGAAALV
jgi:hypothetical protein